ncbi:hypothetical protein ACTXOX_14925 [Pseudomonas helleri]|uniref:hypothetical protein n=1 Tax=Pseudomonas helleri TaxID=1608996 RepID=UPI000652D582|nr:hypothetical protein [Pseudomonas helleri]KMN06749.1 prophage PSSB64-02 [Pseudomonas helleri]
MALQLTKKALTPGLRWVEFDKDTKIQLEGLGNPEYQVALERVRRRTQRNDAIFEQGEVGVLPGEKTEHQNHCALLAQFIVRDWDGVQDDKGNPLKFDVGACAELLDSNIDFFLFVIGEGSKSSEVANEEIAETTEKQ